MTNTIYASFPEAGLAEKAAGALLDHGVRSEDISLVWKRDQDNTSVTSVHPVHPEVGSGVSGTGGPIGTTGVTSQSSVPPVVGGRTFEGGVATPGLAGGFDHDPQTAEPANYDSTDLLGGDDATSRLTTDNEATAQAATEPTVTYGEGTVNDEDTGLSAKQGISTTTAADAGAGAVAGTAIGATIGVGAALASLFIPGIGLVVGGGALATALAGVAASAGAGAAAGALTGYLKDMGVDDQVAVDYEKAVENGGAMLSVTPNEDNGLNEIEIRSLLSKYGASDIRSGVASQQGYLS